MEISDIVNNPTIMYSIGIALCVIAIAAIVLYIRKRKGTGRMASSQQYIAKILRKTDSGYVTVKELPIPIEKKAVSYDDKTFEVSLANAELHEKGKTYLLFDFDGKNQISLKEKPLAFTAQDYDEATTHSIFATILKRLKSFSAEGKRELLMYALFFIFGAVAGYIITKGGL